MVRIQLVRYWKWYLRKNRYRCRRYLFYVPVGIGERVDRSVDYVVRLFGSFIVLAPKGLESLFSKSEKPGEVHPENYASWAGWLTGAMLESSRVRRNHNSA